jgi:peroxiredoxin
VAVLAASTPAGQPSALDVLRGRPVVLHFWSAFCRSCQGEIRNYRDILAELRRVDPEVRLLSVNVDGEADWAREAQANEPLAVEPLLALDTLGWLPSADPVVPLLVVVGRDGRVRARDVGARTPREFAAVFERAAR